MIEEKNIKTNTEIVAEEEKTEVVEQYVFERINSDFKTGLTEDVVLKRQEHGYSNVADTNKGKTVGRIIREITQSFLSLFCNYSSSFVLPKLNNPPFARNSLNLAQEFIKKLKQKNDR